MQHVYTSLGEFLDAAKRPSLVDNPSSHNTDDPSWHGTKNFDEALDLAINGWSKGRDSLMSAMSEAQASPRMTPSMLMDVAGAYPVAALAAAGDPCSMVDLAPIEDRVRPIVRLVVQCGGSSAYEPREFLNYGAAVLSYIEGLEAAGFRVEITVSYAAEFSARSGPYAPGNFVHYLAFLAKRAEEPLEIDRMAFILTHASMFRRIAFAVKESTPGVAEHLRYSAYGFSKSPTPEQVDRDQIIIPGVNMVKPGAKELKTPKAALAHIGPMIEKQLRNAGMAPPPLAFGGSAGK